MCPPRTGDRVKGVGGIKSEKKLLASMIKDIEIFVVIFTGSKNMIFHEDMSLRSWYFIRVNHAFQGVFLGF